MAALDAFEESGFCFIGSPRLYGPKVCFLVPALWAVFFSFWKCFHAFVDDLNFLVNKVCLLFDDEMLAFDNNIPAFCAPNDSFPVIFLGDHQGPALFAEHHLKKSSREEMQTIF